MLHRKSVLDPPKQPTAAKKAGPVLQFHFSILISHSLISRWVTKGQCLTEHIFLQINTACKIKADNHSTRETRSQSMTVYINTRASVMICDVMDNSCFGTERQALRSVRQSQQNKASLLIAISWTYIQRVTRFCTVLCRYCMHVLIGKLETRYISIAADRTALHLNSHRSNSGPGTSVGTPVQCQLACLPEVEICRNVLQKELQSSSVLAVWGTDCCQSAPCCVVLNHLRRKILTGLITD